MHVERPVKVVCLFMTGIAFLAYHVGYIRGRDAGIRRVGWLLFGRAAAPTARGDGDYEHTWHPTKKYEL